MPKDDVASPLDGLWEEFCRHMRQQVPADLRSEIHQLGCLGFLWNTVDLMRWMLVKQGHGCTIPQSSPFFAWCVETIPSHGWFMTLSYQHYKGMLEINTKWCRISNTHQYEINGKHMKYSWVSKNISYPSPRSPKWFATHPGPAAASGLQDQDPSMPAISDELGSCPKPPSTWVFDRQKRESKQGERKAYWNFHEFPMSPPHLNPLQMFHAGHVEAPPAQLFGT